MSSQSETAPWRLEWTDELSVGIPEVDAEHRQFIRLVDELNDAIIRRMDVAEIKKRLQAILDDAMAHFDHEAALFREWNYPEAAEHEEKHARIALTLREMMSRLQTDATEYEWVEAGLAVKKIVIDHLLSEDMKYRDFRRQDGASA
jgi:hemerythrin